MVMKMSSHKHFSHNVFSSRASSGDLHNAKHMIDNQKVTENQILRLQQSKEKWKEMY